MINKKNLITLDNVSKLSVSEVKKIYKENINPGLVKILSSFGSGNELIDKADGMYLYSGNTKILDMTGGLGVLNHGHNDSRILEARINYQKNKIMETHKNHFSRYSAGLAKNLSILFEEKLPISFFCNSGAEAIDGALKISYKYYNGKKKYALHSDRSFHGKTIGASSISSADSFYNKNESSFEFQKIQNLISFKFNDLNSIQEIINRTKDKYNKSNIYSIFVEPFSASTVSESSIDFLQKIKMIAEKEGIVLVFDEIYTGFGKTGHLFNFNKANIYPDIVTISKSLGGGKSSISAYSCSRRLFDKSYGTINSSLMHTTTYNGFGEECATAIEALNILINDNYVEKSKINEEIILNNLEILSQKHSAIIKEYRGCGSLFGLIFNNQLKYFNNLKKIIPLEFFQDKFLTQKLVVGSIVDHLYREHKILTYLTQNTDVILYISPSIIISKEQIKYFFESLDSTLSMSINKLVLKFIKNKFGIIS